MEKIFLVKPMKSDEYYRKKFAPQNEQHTSKVFLCLEVFSRKLTKHPFKLKKKQQITKN